MVRLLNYRLLVMYRQVTLDSSKRLAVRQIEQSYLEDMPQCTQDMSQRSIHEIFHECIPQLLLISHE